MKFLPLLLLILIEIPTSQLLMAQNTLYDEINFDNQEDLSQFYSDSTIGDWQIGVPQKVFFEEAFSLPSAIMTDTIQPFTADIRSSFILKFANSDSIQGEYYSGELCFRHKLEAENGVDFAQVALSANQGEFWSDFTNDQGGFILTEEAGGVMYSEDFYNDWYFDGSDSLYGFSGVFDTYRHTCLSICWYWPVIQGGLRSYPPDSLWVKFTFISGSNSLQNAGWIIDDVTFGDYYCGSGLVEKDLPPLDVFPQPAGERLQFIKPQNTTSQAKLHIYNALGEVVKVSPYQGNQLSIDVQKWSSGLYTYILFDKEIPVNVGKIIISR